MIPTRSLSPFRRNSTNESDKKKKRTSLQIITGTHNEHHQTLASATPSRIRQRLSSLFKSSSSSITIVSSPTTLSSQVEENNKSTDSLSSSSDSNSDHMPASPVDNITTTFWHNTNDYVIVEEKEEQKPLPSPSLAFQVHQILGSTILEVDEEIDVDWEYSRDKLRQSLIQYPTSQIIHF